MNPALFLAGYFQEFCLVDDGPLVAALADDVVLVAEYDPGPGQAPVEAFQLHVRRHAHADRGGGRVTHIHMDADAALVVIQLRGHGFQAGPFH